MSFPTTTVPYDPAPARTRLPLAGQAPAGPPFALPALHFGAAITWLVCGSMLLIGLAEPLAAGAILDQRLIAATHVFTLGVVTTTIFGVLYQVFPSLIGAAARSIPLAFGGFWLLQGGVLALVAGFWWWRAALLGLGWSLLFGAVGVVAWNLLPERRKAGGGGMAGRWIMWGHMMLGTAMLLALARIGATAGWWQVERIGLITAHYHLALYGFAGFTAVAAGSHMFPMFLLAHGYDEKPLALALPMAAGGLAGFGLGATFGIGPLALAGGATAAAGGVLYLRVTADYFRRRNRRPDVGVAHMAGGLLFLALTLATGILLLAVPGPSHPRWSAVYALLGVAGWPMMLIIGVLYKVLPFLTWLHRFGRQPGGSPGVSVARLTSSAAGWTTLVLYGSAVPVMAAGVAAESASTVRAAAVVMSLAAVLVAAQHLRAAIITPHNRSIPV